VEAAQAHTLDVDDGKRLVDVPPCHFGARWHDVMHAALVLLDMELDHALLVGNLIQLHHVDVAQMLDEDGSSLKRKHDLNMSDDKTILMVAVTTMMTMSLW
jgi:hypothetical protein